MKYLILFLVAVLVFSCKRDEVPQEPAIMRIGSAFLTESQLLEAVGENASPEQKLGFIREWSNLELTYQAAVEMGLDRDAAVRRTIEDMRRSLLSVMYIQQAIEKLGSVEIGADEIQREFRDNARLYVRAQPVIRVARIVLDSRVRAWQVRDGLTVENFRARGSYHSGTEIPPFDSVKFAPRSDFNPATWDVIFNTRVNSITVPIEEDGHFSIYLILAKENAGTPAPLEESIEDVKRNILAQKQDGMVENIFLRLRNRYDYTFDRAFMANLERAQNAENGAKLLENAPQEETANPAPTSAPAPAASPAAATPAARPAPAATVARPAPAAAAAPARPAAPVAATSPAPAATVAPAPAAAPAPAPAQPAQPAADGAAQ